MLQNDPHAHMKEMTLFRRRSTTFASKLQNIVSVLHRVVLTWVPGLLDKEKKEEETATLSPTMVATLTLTVLK